MPAIAATVNSAAISGCVVYCLEEIDNGADLFVLSVSKKTKLKAEYELSYGKYLQLPGAQKAAPAGSALYQERFDTEKVDLEFIPYYAFANCGESDMLVWVNS